MAVGVLGGHHNFLFFFLFSPTFSLLIFLFSYFCGTDIGLTPCGSDNGLAPPRRQAIIWTNDGQVYWRMDMCLSASMS